MNPFWLPGEVEIEWAIFDTAFAALIVPAKLPAESLTGKAIMITGKPDTEPIVGWLTVIDLATLVRSHQLSPTTEWPLRKGNIEHFTSPVASVRKKLRTGLYPAKPDFRTSSHFDVMSLTSGLAAPTINKRLVTTNASRSRSAIATAFACNPCIAISCVRSQLAMLCNMLVTVIGKRAASTTKSRPCFRLIDRVRNKLTP